MQEQPRVLVDMDGVLVNYRKAHAAALERCPEIVYPQMSYGFYANLEPVEDAQWAWTELNSVGFDMHILTTPSVLNPLSYTEKRISVEKLFGLDACYKLNMGCDKSMWIGDYLIDDNTHTNKQHLFPGELIHFTSDKFLNWKTVVAYLKTKHNLY